MRARRLINTDYYEYDNANPHNRLSGDCVIRALAVAMDKSWEQVYKDLTEIGLKTGYVQNDEKCYEKYLKSEGWIKCSEPRNWDNTRMKVYQFLKFNKEGNLIANVGSHHIVAIKEGKVHDIWNSSLVTMHSYWRKK